VAELTQASAPRPWNRSQTVAQFRAIAWLRWRILVNGFRRKGGAGELVGRVIALPFLGVAALFPTLGAGAAAWYFAGHGQLARVSWILWATFLVGQLLNINLGQPGTTFDPNELIRFPMRLRSFVAIRLFFGLLSPANILVSAMSLAIATGVSIALPSLWFAALVALFIFGLANVLFTRMVFAWVDRWLSTRRAREIFTLLIFTFSLGFQWVNVTFNPAYNHHRHHRSQAFSQQRVTGAANLYQRVKPAISWLPPELTGAALVSSEQGRWGAYTAEIFATALFAAGFLCVFGLRMRTEYRGEALSDVANAVAPVRKARAAAGGLVPSAKATGSPAATAGSMIPILFGKELLYVRRNTGLFYSLIAPVVMVFLFAGRMSVRSGSVWVFPASIAYTLLTIMPLSFNSFGLEGTGAQFYFMAPVRLRDVFLAKNLLYVLLAMIEMLAVFSIVTYMNGWPTLQMVAVTFLWAIASLLLGLTIGNFRSVSAPKRIQLARTAGKQASPLSALMSIGVLLVLSALGAGLILAARFLNVTWTLIPVFSVLFAAALAAYFFALRGLERYTLNHREELFAELSKL
jgi:ABC-2 type transport system permease protein